MSRDLVSVTFEDNTNYVSYSNDDIIGIPINHCWGPAGELKVMDREEFLRTYPISKAYHNPDSLPKYDGSTYPCDNSLASVLRAFDMGASLVEVVRMDPQTGRWCWFICPGAVTPTADFSQALSDEGTSTSWFSLETIVESEYPDYKGKGYIVLYAKYPGWPPKSKVNGRMEVSVEFGGDDSKDITIRVSVGSTLLEEFVGNLDPEAVVDGESYYIVDKLKNSEYFELSNHSLSTDSWVFDPQYQTKGQDYITTTAFCNYEDGMADSPAESEEELFGVGDGLTDAFSKFYSDRKISRATILVSPLRNSTLYKSIQNIAEQRKNCVAIVGSISFKENPKEAISYMKSLVRDKFSLYVNAEEEVEIFGNKLKLDGTAGYAGRLAYTARVKKLNQLPSAEANGIYPQAVLSKTWNYDQVLEAHEEGVASIYNSYSGPQIFGIRSLHPRQQSYFGKFNVSRVLSFILKSMYEEVDSDIHTDIVSDDVARASAETRLNSIIQSFAPDNIKSNSYAYIISSDEETMGGELMIVVAEIWFKKLAEKVQIRIVATDSSVSTEVS